MNFALLLRHRSIEPVLTLLPSHSGLKLRNAASLRYMLQDGTHKGRSPLQEADNKAGAGKQRPLQPGKETPAHGTRWYQNPSPVAPGAHVTASKGSFLL